MITEFREWVIVILAIVTPMGAVIMGGIVYWLRSLSERQYTFVPREELDQRLDKITDRIDKMMAEFRQDMKDLLKEVHAVRLNLDTLNERQNRRFRKDDDV